VKNLKPKLKLNNLWQAKSGIVNNSFFGIAFQVTNLLIGMLIISLIAHTFGSATFGQYSLSQSLSGILAIALGMSVNIPIYRAIAMKRKRIILYFVNALMIKSFGLLILLPFSILILSFFITPHYQKITLLSTLFIAFNGIVGFYQGILITKGLNYYNFIINLGSKLLQLLSAYIINDDFILLLLAFNIIILLNFIVYHYLTPKEITGSLKNYYCLFNLKIIKKLVIISIPLILISFSEFITLKIDQIILGIIRNEKEVGYYSAAVNIIMAYSLITLAVTQVFFPNYIQKLIKSANEARKFFFLIVNIFLVFSLAMVLLTYLFSDFIIITIYGKEFIPASKAVVILSFSLFFITVNRLTSTAINSHGKYIYTLKITLTGTLINLILNILLIPKYGIMGASIVTIISEAIVAVLGFIFIIRLNKINN
jgi:O-antigen/teichoic acid export membrane protein